MKMSAVKNFTFFSLHVFPFICKFFYYLLSFVSIISYLLYTQISVVIQRFTTSEMRLYFLMFITVFCFLSLLSFARFGGRGFRSREEKKLPM